MRLALQHKGIRTEALARTDEIVFLHVIAFKMEDIGGNGEMDFFNAKLPKASNQHSVFNVNIMLALQIDMYTLHGCLYLCNLIHVGNGFACTEHACIQCTLHACTWRSILNAQ